jgi:alpha-methylacyl-CoA racemase
LLDSGAHFYDTYRTKDGKFVSVGPIEAQFYALFREKLGLADDPAFDRQNDSRSWRPLREKLTAIFAGMTRDEACALLEHTDACFAPVLSMTEAPLHPHNAARGTFVEAGGVTQPSPAPRYSATKTDAPRMQGGSTDSDAVLAGLGYDSARIAALKGAGTVA